MIRTKLLFSGWLCLTLMAFPLMNSFANDSVVVDTNGNVGIGTNSPVAKLEVAGTIHSTSGGVQFPDGTTQQTASSSPQIYDSGWFHIEQSIFSPYTIYTKTHNFGALPSNLMVYIRDNPSGKIIPVDICDLNSSYFSWDINTVSIRIRIPFCPTGVFGYYVDDSGTRQNLTGANADLRVILTK